MLGAFGEDDGERGMQGGDCGKRMQGGDSGENMQGVD